MKLERENVVKIKTDQHEIERLKAQSFKEVKEPVKPKSKK